MSREDSTTSNAIGDRLRDAGLRRTPVRVAVLARVGASRKPLSAADVIGKLDDGTDAVTVYRTLNTLAEHKLVHRVRGDDGAWRYAASPAGQPEHAEHPHAHFVCDGCGTVECLDAVAVPDDLVRPRDLGRRYDVTYAELLVHGLCPKCHA